MTNQIENGNQELETDTIANRWEQVSLGVDEYFEKIKLKTKPPDGILSKILEMPHAELRTLSAEECGEYAFVLSQYRIFLQKEINYHESKIRWADDNLKYFVWNSGLPVCLNTYIPLDEKAAYLAKHHNNTKQLLKMQTQARVIFGNLNSMTQHLDSMTRVLLSLQQSKRGQNR